jgi:cytochrome c-type biogenesis protein CcmF
MAMLIFAVLAALVLLGTSAPLFTRLWGDAAAVSMDYYNRIAFPLAIALSFLLGCYPYFKWRGEGTQIGQKVATAALLALAGTVIAYALGVHQAGNLLFTFAALFAAFGNMLYLLFYFRTRWYLVGSYVSHMGFGILLLGVLMSSAFNTSEKIELREGDVRTALGYEFKYMGKTTNLEANDGRLHVAVRKGDDFFMAYPRFYWSEFNQGFMRKPHVHKTAFYDIYVAPEEHYAEGENPEDRFANSLELLKGQTSKYDDVEYTFEDFEIGSHTDGTGNMRVTAKISARAYGGETEVLEPYLELTADGGRIQGPATLASGMVVSLAGIQADAGAILLQFEKQGQKVQQASLLVLEVSRKPLVSLVWLGSVMALLGTFVALYFRSRSEFARERQEAKVRTGTRGGKAAKGQDVLTPSR